MCGTEITTLCPHFVSLDRMMRKIMITSTNLPVNSQTILSNSISQFESRYITHERYKLLSSLAEIFLFNERGRKKASYGVIKLICSRDLKFGSCIAKQRTICREASNFGNTRDIGERQLRRITKALKNQGLITFERSKGKRSANRYECTELGRQLYFLFIQDNRDYIQYKLSTNCVDNPVNKNSNCSIIEQFTQLPSIKTPNESVEKNKNVLSNMDIKIMIKNNINIMRLVKNCTIFTQTIPEKYKMSSQKPIPPPPYTPSPSGLGCKLIEKLSKPNLEQTPMTEEDVQKLRDAYSQDPDPRMDPAPPPFRSAGMRPRERSIENIKPIKQNDFYEPPMTYRDRQNGDW